MPNLKKFCLICCQKIAGKYLRSHLCDHFDYQPYHCEHAECRMSFSDEKQIDIHFETKHNGVKRMTVESNNKIEIVLLWIIDNYDYLSLNNNNSTNLSQLIRHKMTQILAKIQPPQQQQKADVEEKSIASCSSLATANCNYFKSKAVGMAKKSIYTPTFPRPMVNNHRSTASVVTFPARPLVNETTATVANKHRTDLNGVSTTRINKYWPMASSGSNSVVASKRRPTTIAATATAIVHQRGEVVVVSGRKPSVPRDRGQGLTHPRKSHKSRMPYVQTKHLRKQIIIAGNSYASCQLCQRLVQAYPSHVETHVLQHLRDDNQLQWVAACLMCPPNAQLRTLYRSNLIRIHLTRKHGQQNPQPGVHYLDHTDRYTEMIEQKRALCFPSQDNSNSKVSNNADFTSDTKLLADDAVKSEPSSSEDNNDDGTITTNYDGTVVLNTNGTASRLLKLCIKCNRNVVNSPSFRKKHVLTHLLDERKIDWLLSCSLCPVDRQYRSISYEDLTKNHLPMVHGVERALVNVHYVDRTNDYKFLISSTANQYLV